MKALEYALDMFYKAYDQKPVQVNLVLKVLSQILKDQRNMKNHRT